MSFRDDAQLGGSSKGSIALRAETPNPLANPTRVHAVPDLLDDPRAVAVRNDSGVGHPDAECVLPLLDVSRVHSGHRDADEELAGGGRWFSHVPDD
jgi:hypothetical protein